MDDLIILGAGGLAKQVFWILQKSKAYNVIGFLDETMYRRDFAYHGKPILNDVDKIIRKNGSSRPVYLVCAVGSGGNHLVKKRWVQKYSPDFKFATIIDPDARIAEDVKIGEGSIVQAFTVCGPGVSLGKHVRIGYSSILAHDITVGDFCSISNLVGFGGFVKLGNGVDIGIGGVILPRITVCDGSVIGAGAVVTKRTEKNKTYAGVPAKELKK